MAEPKTNPDLDKFGKNSLELIAALANEVAALKEAKKPVESLLALGRAADKIALLFHRKAVLQADLEKPAQINPLVEITALNVGRCLESAARDLVAQKGLPKTWEDAAAVLKDQAKVVQAVQLLISQVGVAGTVVQPGPPLVDADGKPLVDDEKKGGE